MSRTRRKPPIIGMTTMPSDKPFKVAEHQRERHHVRQVLRVALDEDAVAIYDPMKLLRGLLSITQPVPENSLLIKSIALLRR